MKCELWDKQGNVIGSGKLASEKGQGIATMTATGSLNPPAFLVFPGRVGHCPIKHYEYPIRHGHTIIIHLKAWQDLAKIEALPFGDYRATK